MNAIRDLVQDRQRDGLKAGTVDVAQFFQFLGRGSSKLPSPPTMIPVEVMISSRMGSIGGLVTCANNCLK
jgi:hypothetical protein